jgi:N-formylglutamate deformylase
MPHIGTHIPDDMLDHMVDGVRAVPDTDWHLDRLYDFLADMGANVIMATHSRYVVDLNRSRTGDALYPGQSETGLCPLDSFAGQPLYLDGHEPDGAEIERRIERYWQPYHDRIAAELSRIKARYGYALLWDAHSIKSHVPRFFEGRLPDLNLGSGGGVTCDADLSKRVHALVRKSGYSTALNGRFKGGYITRHYGNPAANIHALQLEIAQCIYMNEDAPYGFCDDKAQQLRPLLRQMLDQFREGVTP